jgi:predicted amidohydrolase
MRITLAQTDIVWEDKTFNLAVMQSIVEQEAATSDLIIFPEMCTTGFAMQNSRKLAEEMTGETVTLLKEWAGRYQTALCGSFIALENDQCYNRCFFITPLAEYCYDKRHLFTYGGETQFFSAGSSHTIVNYLGIRICLQVCYDLRFPVWTRNTGDLYDMLIYVANWPTVRIDAWLALLRARAIENMCYVCGVNRTGSDENQMHYNGNSLLVDARNRTLLHLPETPCCQTAEITLEGQNRLRSKFPALDDADSFQLG